MKKIIQLITMLFLGINGSAQNIEKQKKEIVAEGKLLYKSEMASWYGTDLFMEKSKGKSNIGGYFSYSDEKSSKCIFFSKDQNPKVIGTISFDETFNTKTAKTEFDERSFSKKESDLYLIRQNALKTINADTIFKQYNNTNLNLIPIISDNVKKVYVLTGPKVSGVVIYGNDYLLTFDDKNNLTSKKKLHANIIPVQYGNKEKQSIASIHSHNPETGDLITATDICTTLLYEKFTTWETVYVMSKKYVSIWNCKTDELTVMSTEAFEKINKKDKKM